MQITTTDNNEKHSKAAWLTPNFERQSLKDALNTNNTGTLADDGVSGYS